MGLCIEHYSRVFMCEININKSLTWTFFADIDKPLPTMLRFAYSGVLSTSTCHYPSNLTPFSIASCAAFYQSWDEDILSVSFPCDPIQMVIDHPVLVGEYFFSYAVAPLLGLSKFANLTWEEAEGHCIGSPRFVISEASTPAKPGFQCFQCRPKVIVESYNPSAMLFDGKSDLHELHRTMEYMRWNHCSHGIMTTYAETKFLIRSGEHCLVSEAVPSDTARPSLRRIIAYFLHTALSGESSTLMPNPPTTPTIPTPPSRLTSATTATTPRPPMSTTSTTTRSPTASSTKSKRVPRKKRRRSSKLTHRKRGAKAKRGGLAMPSLITGLVQTSNAAEPTTTLAQTTICLQGVTPKEVQFLGILGYGRTGTVYHAIIGQVEMALKVADISHHPELLEELENEVSVYQRLQSLQGKCIPKLLAQGRFGGAMFFGIGTSLLGPVAPLTSENRSKALAALKAIHSCGVLHRDIRPENLLLGRGHQGHQVFVIDLAFARASPHNSDRHGDEQSKFEGEEQTLLQLYEPQVQS